MVEVTHLSECLVRTAGKLKNREHYNVHWGLSQASKLGNKEGALVPARRRDPGRDTEILSMQRGTLGKFSR